ncbi:RNA-directed DNA polymerase from mobile element jockey-like isoform X1 [Rhizophagus irregularis DAOM 181602=DAOM 197198]|nr:RNA-directed DNA polymerase from mobile element jockey-like isoform X1 [Rhizophagus irregularis DAOM 181602=DAOM 197198]
MSDNFNYDTFVRNPPNPEDTYNFSEHESLFSSLNSSPIPNSFNISSFNVNGLRHNSQVKIEQISNFFNLKHISFGGIVDTHLSPKQIHYLSKRLPNYTVFSSDIDKIKHVNSTGGVSLFIEKSLASHVQDFVSHSSRILSVDLYFKGNIKLRIFVIYIPPFSDSKLRSETIDLLLQLLVQTKQQNFHHAICGDFNMHLDTYYPIYFNRPSVASQRAHRLLYHLLSHGYEETIPVNASDSLGTFHRDDQITRIDYVWSCPMLKSFALTSYIFDAQDTCFSDHNPVITYFDDSLLSASIKVARAKQLRRRTRRIFKFDSVTSQQWDFFSTQTDSLCDVPPSTFSTWHINQQCEYLHSHIVKAANASLPSVTVGNQYTPTMPKDLEALTQHYRFLSRLLHSIRLLRKYPSTYYNRYERIWSIHFDRLQKILHLYKKVIPSPPILPTSLSTCRQDNFKFLLDSLKIISSALHGLLLLKEKDFQDSSIRAKLDDRDNNFETDISSFIDSALSRTRRRITLDHVFVDHPTQPKLLTDPHDIDDIVIDHFQNSVPIKSSPPDNISALPEKWFSAYHPMDDVDSSIYDSLLDPPTLEEWLSTVSSMPNDKAPGPSMITYEMLKHLGSNTSALVLILVQSCFCTADIPNLWRQAMVFPIPKPHEWKCQLKNTRPITLLEVIRKSLVKLLYNRLASTLASNEVLKGGNFAGLPGGSCRDPIVVLESIIHDAHVNKSPLWILSQDISKAFDSVDLKMLRFALERIKLPASATKFILSLFMKRSNRVFTAHGTTPSYRVRIGIDQGEVISPLLWVIYIDPLLTVLKNEMIDPYTLHAPSLFTPLAETSSDGLRINNLVFMDDSTLISSSKSGMESMLSITEEFYQINNTSANHNKYVLITNSLPSTSAPSPSPVVFDLQLSGLNKVPSISIVPISMNSSFRFLGVWFNVAGSRDFVKKQVARECNSFAAIVRPAKLSAKQVVYLHNTVLIPKLDYRMQVTHLSESECALATSSIRSLVKHKANFSRVLPDSILFLSQGLGLINLFFHQSQSHLTNLFLLANSSSFFMKSLFLYRLRLIQFSFLIPISPLLVKDWTLWSKLLAFKQDYIACTIALLTTTPFMLSRSRISTSSDLTVPDGHTPLFEVMTPKIFISYFRRLRSLHLYYLSQFITPQGTHMITWKVYLSGLSSRKGHRVLPHKWFNDIHQCVTIPSSNSLLLDQFSSDATPSNIDLVPAFGSSRKSMKWIVTLDDDGSPLFGKQLSKQQYSCKIVHWISDCATRPNDVITLTPCPGCSKHVPVTHTKSNPTDVTPLCIIPKLSPLRSLILPTTQERIRHDTTAITSPFTWADLDESVRSYYGRLDIHPDFSQEVVITLPSPSPPPSLGSAAPLAFAVSPLATPPDNHYCFYTDGSLINLGTPDVSMAEIAAIHAALTVTPPSSTVTIHTDSQSAIDGLRLCATFSYSNSRLYYKTTNFELWAIIERLISSKSLSVTAVKVKGHSGNFYNDYADSLANSAHTSSSAILLSNLDQVSPHEFLLKYDDILCESNPRRLFKQYSQMLWMHRLTRLSHFNFTIALSSTLDFVIDWDLTWFLLNSDPQHDASFTRAHASSYRTFKFKLFLEDLPTLEHLKRIHPDLYIDILSCRSCLDSKEDFMHLFMCKCRRITMEQILLSYQQHFINKLQEAGDLVKKDPSLIINKFKSLPCWSFSSSNWTSYSLVISAIHNHFIQKIRKRIWLPRSYDKSKWEDAMNITQKLKLSRPSNLPKSTYLPFSTLPPPTLSDAARDSDVDYLKNSMKYGLPWFNHYSGFMGRLTVQLTNSFSRVVCRF